MPSMPIEHFGLDMAGCGGWFDALPMRGVEEMVEETDEWKVSRNGAGAALKWWKNKSGTPEHVDFRMTSREIWERDYRPHLLAVDRARVDVPGAAEALASAAPRGAGPTTGTSSSGKTCGRAWATLPLYTSLLADPDWIHDYGRVYTDFFKTCLRAPRSRRPAGPTASGSTRTSATRHRLFARPEVARAAHLPVLPGAGRVLPHLRPAGRAAHLRLHGAGRCRPHRRRRGSTG